LAKKKKKKKKKSPFPVGNCCRFAASTNLGRFFFARSLAAAHQCQSLAKSLALVSGQLFVCFSFSFSSSFSFFLFLFRPKHKHKHNNYYKPLLAGQFQASGRVIDDDTTLQVT